MAIIEANRFFLFALACIHTLLTSGVVYGWAGLEYIIQEAGVYNSLCTDPAYSSNLAQCPQIVSRLNLVFVLGATGLNLSNLPFGYIMDKFGPRMTTITGCTIFAAGCFLIAGYSFLPIDGILVGFFCLGLGGPAVQLPAFLTCEVQGTLMAVLTALFDGSTVIFLLFQWTFLVYGFVVICIGASAALFWSGKPRKDQDMKTAAPTADTETASAVQLKDVAATTDSVAEAARTPSQMLDTFIKPLFDVPVKRQIFSIAMLYIVMFTALHVLRLNFVIGTLRTQLADRGFSDSAGKHLTMIFQGLLPLGFVIIPVIGWLLDKKGYVPTFLFVNVANIVWGIFFSINNAWCLLISFMIFATCRQMVYASCFSYIQSTFGYVNFGTLIGVTNVTVAVFGFLQNFFIWITLDFLNAEFVWSNVFLTLLPLPLLVFPLVDRHMKKMSFESVPLLGGNWPVDKEKDLDQSGTDEKDIVVEVFHNVLAQEVEGLVEEDVLQGTIQAEAA